MKKKILFLLNDGDLSRILFNKLNNPSFVSYVIIDKPVSKVRIVLNRIKRIGFLSVLGQLFFVLFVVKLLRLLSYGYIKKLILTNCLSTQPISTAYIQGEMSINSDECICLIKKIKPDLIIVHGTRIIQSRVLNSITVDFINLHMGITPKYRGVHGAYWALVNNDIKNIGVTIHFVDRGIDTGKVICQSDVSISSNDNFVTYPYLQMITAVSLFPGVLHNYFVGTLQNVMTGGESMLFYHPTVCQYIKYRLLFNIK